eukprot:CAMPEP_0172477738 /NCGR_PEP_ID=MMETSP1066-20121228/1181_1 /TAXON_ID=671091 /ORGANISM="Coscinodiscus wailesii, Strain CCMP2513" /LENGTH=95 /DNA_ID=CAMNT_0013236585 /DNA_START=484 /DNA_END=768 /DNA_ORIENTATION=-
MSHGCSLGGSVNFDREWTAGVGKVDVHSRDGERFLGDDVEHDAEVFLSAVEVGLNRILWFVGVAVAEFESHGCSGVTDIVNPPAGRSNVTSLVRI